MAYSLNLDAQYQVITNLAVGRSFLNWTNIEAGSLDATMCMFGPQVTYNVSYDDKPSFFDNLGIGCAKYDLGNGSGGGFLFRIGGGVKYFLTRNVALIELIRYKLANLDNNYLDEINLNFGISVAL